MKTMKKIRGPEITFQSEEEKDLIERAALFTGITTTSFIRLAALESARSKIEEQRKLTLSNRDFEAFIADLENPYAPSESLKKLMRSNK